MKIWCPFDTEESLFVKMFRDKGYQVIATHIVNGEDFFSIEPPICDFIISNPPYSLKAEVFDRLFQIGKPFAMLVGVVGLFESQKRSLNPPFSSVYVCKDILPKQIVFEEVDK